MVLQQPIRLFASLLLVIGMPALAYLQLPTRRATPPIAESKQALDSNRSSLDPTDIPHRRKLATGPIVVGASDPYALRFVVADDMQNTRVVGSFSASGGLSNDIELFLFDEDNFLKWRDRRDGRPLFHSPRTARGNINERISKSGVYYLVFNNDFAFLEPKTVRAEIILEYQTVKESRNGPYFGQSSTDLLRRLVATRV